MLNGIEAMKDTGGVLTVKSQLGEDGQIGDLCTLMSRTWGCPWARPTRYSTAFFTTKTARQRHGLGNL